MPKPMPDGTMARCLPTGERADAYRVEAEEIAQHPAGVSRNSEDNKQVMS